MADESTNTSAAADMATPVTDAATNPTATAPANDKPTDADGDTKERRTTPVTLIQGSFGLAAGSQVRVTPTMAEQLRAQGLAR